MTTQASEFSPTELSSTDFSNHSVTTQELPTLLSLEQQSISPSYAKANRYINLFTTLLLMLIALAVSYQPFFDISEFARDIFIYIAWVIAAIGLLSTLYSAKADIRKFYALREQDINYTSGLIFKKAVSQPILRIQHVELKRGPIDRKIGLAKLQVFSAGGAMHTFEIPGLELEEAESIRQFILSHKDTNHHG